MGIIASETTLDRRYQIVRSLAPEGRSRTYLAMDSNRFNAECAIEDLTPDVNDREMLGRSKESLLVVASLLYQLQHPQIPRFWATFEEKDRLFLVRDYIRGLTYAELLEERRAQGTQFTEGEVRKFLSQMLPVLGYIHSKGFIHQDICPQNIILRDDPNLELLPVPIDFGAIEEASRRFSQSGGKLAPIGTPGYIAPERLTNGSSSPSSDLYSLAATAVVLLTGKAATDLANEDGEWDDRWCESIAVSDDLADILMRMLDREPQNRYPSATDVLQDLGRHQKLEISSLRGTLSESSIPTIDVNSSFYTEPVPKNRVYTSLTNLRVKSIWENPAIFIPLGLLVSIVAGFGAWFGMSQILQRQKTTTTATPTVAVAPSQDSTSPTPTSDFKNPTVESSAATSGESIQLTTGQSIAREGTVDSGATVKYRLQATTGQTVDIATGSTQVLMTIFDSTGVPVSKGERVSSWRGELATGEYSVELRPLQGLEGKGFPYKVAIVQSATIASPSSGTDATTTIPGMSAPTTNSGVVPPMGQTDINATGGSSTTNIPATASPIPVVPVSVPSERPQTSIDRSASPTTKTETETERPRRRRVVRQQTETTNTSSEETPRRRRVVRQEAENNNNSNEEAPPRRRRVVRQEAENNNNSNKEAPRRRRRVVRQEEPQTAPASKPADSAGENTEKLPEYKTPIAVPKPKNGTAPADNDSGGEGNSLDTE